MNEDYELVSVLMCVCNEPVQWLKNAIESIINQTYKKIEFVIVCDSPQNKEILELLYQYEKKYNFVKIIINSQNIGLVKSLNKGIKCCLGNYIARMDADDISLNNRIEKEYCFMKEKGYDIVGCGMIKFNEKCHEELVQVAKKHENCIKILRYGLPVFHPTWLVKKNVYEKMGGYREMSPCEDIDFLIRAVINKYKIGNINEYLYKYRINQNGISMKNGIIQKEISQWLIKNFENNKIVSYEEFLNNKFNFEYDVKIPIFEKIIKRIYIKFILIKENLFKKLME